MQGVLTNALKSPLIVSTSLKQTPPSTLLVLNFAIQARQYFAEFYFRDFNRQIWREKRPKKVVKKGEDFYSQVFNFAIFFTIAKNAKLSTNKVIRTQRGSTQRSTPSLRLLRKSTLLPYWIKVNSRKLILPKQFCRYILKKCNVFISTSKQELL